MKLPTISAVLAAANLDVIDELCNAIRHPPWSHAAFPASVILNRDWFRPHPTGHSHSHRRALMAFRRTHLEHISCATRHSSHTAAGGKPHGQESHQSSDQDPHLSHGMPNRIYDARLQQCIFQLASAARKDLSSTRAAQVARWGRAIGRSKAIRCRQARSGRFRDCISGESHRGHSGRGRGPRGRRKSCVIEDTTDRGD